MARMVPGLIGTANLQDKVKQEKESPLSSFVETLKFK